MKRICRSRKTQNRERKRRSNRYHAGVPEGEARMKTDLDQMLYRLPQAEDADRVLDYVRKAREIKLLIDIKADLHKLCEVDRGLCMFLSNLSDDAVKTSEEFKCGEKRIRVQIK